jgi:MFS family permease
MFCIILTSIAGLLSENPYQPCLQYKFGSDMALQCQETELELRERNTLPANGYPSASQVAADEMQLNTGSSTWVAPLESNNAESYVHNPSPSTILVAAISVDRRAIMIVIASFLLTFTGCGLNFAFGVYQELYETSAGPFQGKVSPAKIDLIGTLAVSLMTIGAPFASAWTRIYSPRAVTFFGAILFAIANILSSFSTKLWHFILTQGFLLGCGTCLSYIPAVTVAPGWFNQRRGLAMGIILSGTGVGGVVWAPLLRYLNTAIGFRNTMRATGILAFTLISLSSLILKWESSADLQRRQENETRTARQRRFNIPLVNWNIVRSRTFAAQAIGAILQAAAYYTPIYFFSSYARTLGYSDIAGANFIALSNASSACGKVFLGFLADRYGRLNALVLCTVVSAMSTVGLWLPSSVLQNQNLSRGLFLAFSSIYGITAGAYVSLFPTALAEQFGVQNFASINGLLYMLRGIGTLIGTPVAGSLIHGNSGPSSHLASSFEKTSLMVGCLLFGASLAVSWARIEAGARAHWPWKM